jgi:hypothetical protein
MKATTPIFLMLSLNSFLIVSMEKDDHTQGIPIEPKTPRTFWQQITCDSEGADPATIRGNAYVAICTAHTCPSLITPAVLGTAYGGIAAANTTGIWAGIITWVSGGLCVLCCAGIGACAAVQAIDNVNELRRPASYHQCEHCNHQL